MPIGINKVSRNSQIGTGIPDSGVSRWNFEDDSDTSTAIDSWETEDGSINGASYTVDSQVDSHALLFDGVDDYVGDFTDAAYSFTSDFSIGAWVKINNHKTRNPILAKGRTRSFEDVKDYYLGVGGGNVFGDVSDGSTSADNLKGSAVSTGNWIHVVLTFDGSTLVLYLDGSEDISTSLSLSVQDAHTLSVGRGDSESGTAFFDGIIDESRIYSKALTATEVSNWYSTGSINA